MSFGLATGFIALSSAVVLELSADTIGGKSSSICDPLVPCAVEYNSGCRRASVERFQGSCPTVGSGSDHGAARKRERAVVSGNGNLVHSCAWVHVNYVTFGIFVLGATGRVHAIGVDKRGRKDSNARKNK